MSEQDQTAWAVQALMDLRTDGNGFTIDNVIQVIKDQQAEIESLRGSMEGQLLSLIQISGPTRQAENSYAVVCI